MILHGGENVAPTEVEAVLHGHSAVLQVMLHAALHYNKHQPLLALPISLLSMFLGVYERHTCTQQTNTYVLRVAFLA